MCIVARALKKIKSDAAPSGTPSPECMIVVQQVTAMRSVWGFTIAFAISWLGSRAELSSRPYLN
eukprot:6045894-Lingulodinium_polyedra.AAC.1